MKKLWTFIIIIIAILSLIACNNVVENNDMNSENYINNNEITDSVNVNISEVPLDAILDDQSQLKEKLLEAELIELKDDNNFIIGILQEDEEIVDLIDDLFGYKIENEYINKQDPKIIGPINFYFSNAEDIYGLMYNEYIYIEGYYFLINNNIAQEIENLFKSNLASAPINVE